MHIEEIFHGKTFKSEQEGWEYLLTINDLFYVGPNGIYMFEGPALISSLEFTEYFQNTKDFRAETGDRLIKRITSLYLELKDGRIHIMSFGNFTYRARQERFNGVMLTTNWEDRLDTDFWEPKKITQEQKAKALQDLAEAMVMDPKKIDESENN